MKITNKQTVLIYMLSPFLTGIVFANLIVITLNSEKKFDLILVKFGESSGYLFNLIQQISIINGVAYVCSVLIFLAFIVIPPKLINWIPARKSRLNLLIGVMIIGIVLAVVVKFKVIFHFEDSKRFFSFILAASLIIIIYALVFLMTQGKVAGLNKKKHWIDKLIHFVLCGMLGGILFGLWLLLFDNEQLGKLLSIGVTPYFMAIMGLVYFFIPAMITGFCKVFITHLNLLKQVVICSFLGFVTSFLETYLFTLGLPRTGMLTPNFVGCLGGTTALLVTIIVNLLDTSQSQRTHKVTEVL